MKNLSHYYSLYPYGLEGNAPPKFKGSKGAGLFEGGGVVGAGSLTGFTLGSGVAAGGAGSGERVGGGGIDGSWAGTGILPVASGIVRLSNAERSGTLVGAGGNAAGGKAMSLSRSRLSNASSSPGMLIVTGTLATGKGVASVVKGREGMLSLATETRGIPRRTASSL